MAVAVNLIPVTGQPLPLISRGGTSTVITCIYFGIILSVSRFGAGMGEDEIVEETEEATEETEINDEADSDETEKLGKKTITELETIVE
jgi:cell division protein FtsW